MAKQKSQNLKLTTVKKKSKEFDTTETYEIQSQYYKGEQVTFYPLFSDSTIDELLTEYHQLFLEAKEKELTIADEMQLILLQFLTIKHFSHFKKDIPSNIVEIIEWLEHFRKTGLFKELLENMFLPQETAKIFSRLTDFVATKRVQKDLEGEAQKKFESLKLKNQFAFDQLRNLKVDNEDENNVF